MPYAIITVVAALAWKFAFDPVTGFVNPRLGIEHVWLTEPWSVSLVIILTAVWKITLFMALLLLAGVKRFQSRARNLAPFGTDPLSYRPRFARPESKGKTRPR